MPTYWATIGQDIIGHHDRRGVWFTQQSTRASRGEGGNEEIDPRGKGRRAASVAATMMA